MVVQTLLATRTTSLFALNNHHLFVPLLPFGMSLNEFILFNQCSTICHKIAIFMTISNGIRLIYGGSRADFN